MENIRWVGKLCLVVAIALELGAIFINLREGHSAFYLFDLAYKFSIDNNFFLVYWGAIIGIFFFLSDFINKSETKHASEENANQLETESASEIEKPSTLDSWKDRFSKWEVKNQMRVDASDLEMKNKYRESKFIWSFQVLVFSACISFILSLMVMIFVDVLFNSVDLAFFLATLSFPFWFIALMLYSKRKWS